jgi:predicted hotdog family 3-hydroxylacyl-ACP dehydratase
MLLIGEILSFDGHKAVTRSVVSEQWPLVDQWHANALVLIELVAQTAAVNNGWTLTRDRGPEVDHRGWIVGIKASRLFVETLPIGTIVEVSSENTFAYDSLREIQGTARIDGQVVAEVTLQLMQAKSVDPPVAVSP